MVICSITYVSLVAPLSQSKPMPGFLVVTACVRELYGPVPMFQGLGNEVKSFNNLSFPVPNVHRASSNGQVSRIIMMLRLVPLKIDKEWDKKPSVTE